METLTFISQSLYVWAIVQTFVIAVAIFIMKRKDFVLLYGLIFLLICIESILKLVFTHFHGMADNFIILMFVYEFCNLVYGPIIFISFLWSISTRLSWRAMLAHGALPIIFLFYYFGFIVLPNQPFKMFDWLFTSSNLIWLILCGASCFFYFGYTYYKIKQNDGYTPSIFTKPLIGYLILKGINSVVVVIHMKVYLINLITEAHVEFMFQMLYLACNVYVIVATIFLAFKTQNVFSSHKIQQKQTHDISEYDEKIQELKRLMNQEEVFAKPDINMESLADMIGVPHHLMSRILNESIGMSFWDYMNSARIELAKKILKDSKEKNLSVAIRCGYNSESVFYRNFRKLTGMTPRKFQELTNVGH